MSGQAGNEGPAGPERAFFGRRKGKALRAAQEERLRALLPRLRVPFPSGPCEIDPASLFPGRIEAIGLEIGFGGGEHLAAEAGARPGWGFIGCEVFVNGVAKLLRVVDEEGLGNIRFWDQDAADLLPGLPAVCLDRVDLLYPDPWPKRRQRKRRFVSDESLREITRVLKPGGLFRFATDIDDYTGWTLARAMHSPHLAWTAERARDWREPWPGWPGTRYEAKALREGRRPSYLTFARNDVAVSA